MLIFFELPKKNRQIIIPLNDALTEYAKVENGIIQDGKSKTFNFTNRISLVGVYSGSRYIQCASYSNSGQVAWLHSCDGVTATESNGVLTIVNNSAYSFRYQAIIS